MSRYHQLRSTSAPCDSHDDVKLLPAALGIHRNVIAPFHTNNHLEPVPHGDVRLLVLARELDLCRAVRDLQILLQMPRAKRVEQRGVHRVVVVRVEGVRRRIVDCRLGCELGNGRVLCRVRIVRYDGQEGKGALKLLRLLDEEQGELLRRLVSRDLLLLRKVVRFFCPSAECWEHRDTRRTLKRHGQSVDLALHQRHESNTDRSVVSARPSILVIQLT